MVGLVQLCAQNAFFCLFVLVWHVLDEPWLLKIPFFSPNETLFAMYYHNSECITINSQ